MRIGFLFFIGGLALLFSVLVLSLATTPTQAQTPTEFVPTSPDRRRTVNVDFLGVVTFTTGLTFSETEIGGLSGLAYDPVKDVYYALSDDRSQINPARFYTLNIDLADGQLQDGDITFQGVTTLLDAVGEPFSAASLDPEGMVFTGQGTVFISSEGDAGATPPILPFVNEFLLDGKQLRTLPVPSKFLPTTDGASGIRNNLAFESLTLTPDGRWLYTATENALAQDGPAADLEQGSLSRVIKYDLATGEPVQELVYPTDPVAQVPTPENELRTNGLAELLAADNNGTLLALERSFSIGKGTTIKLYEARSQGSLDVSSQDALSSQDGEPFELDHPIVKRRLLDLVEVGLVPDNIEALAFGPPLADGRQTLIMLSDNNFNETQVTQFVALALTFKTIPVALPKVETPLTINTKEAPEEAIPGDSADPAIWVHPTDSDQSLIIATLKDGGLAVFDLNGTVLETILPADFGKIRYNNVDLVYNFELGGQPIDLAVASDGANDTLAIFKIDPKTRQLADVTAADIIKSIFGEDNGERSAYGLANYTSPISGQTYVFISQRAGNQVVQLELTDNGSGQVQAEVVRTLELATPSKNAEDAQSKGLIVDRELGLLYVAMENGLGIFKFSAEPDRGNEAIRTITNDSLWPDVEGMTLYYGPNSTGYLLVSCQGDSTYAVFERAGDNTYVGNFIVGDHGEIDQANESDGADVINVPLGSNYPFGLLVVQDGPNDPQFTRKDKAKLENISTNFKFVPWENVANTFVEPLLIDATSYNPRH